MRSDVSMPMWFTVGLSAAKMFLKALTFLRLRSLWPEVLCHLQSLKMHHGPMEAFFNFVRQEFEDMVKKSKEDMEGRLRVGGERRCGVERHGCLWMQFAIYNLFRGNLGQPQIFCK